MRNRKSYKSTVVSSDEVISLASVKAFLRIDQNDDDAMIESFIDAAIDHAEKLMRRSIRTQTIVLTMDSFPYGEDDRMARLGPGVFQFPQSFITGGSDFLDLAHPPVNSVTSVVTYDEANSPTTMPSAQYFLDENRIVLNTGYNWPTSLRSIAAIKITYEAGYGAALPYPVSMAIKQHVSAMYDCRSGCELPSHALNALSPYIVMDQLAW